MNILSELIKIQSITGKEKKLKEFIVNYLKNLNLNLNPIEQTGNVVVHFRGKNRTTALIFDAHMDTVSPGDLSLWKYPPLEGTVENKKIFGLGASDEKASIASLFLLAEYLKYNQPLCDIWLAFVTHEETNGYGTKSFIKYFKKHQKNYQEIAAIITEPTDCNAIEIGHRGNIKIKISVQGDSGHASRPHEIQTHSIESMIQMIAKMNSLAMYIKEKYKDDILGHPTFALTGIYSNETSLNKIPNTCSSIWDIRTTPKLHHNLFEFLHSELSTTVSIHQLEKPGHPPSFINEKEKIVKTFKKILPKIQIKISPGANDSYFFIKENIPAVAFGPGIKKVIHKENEYAEIKNIEKAFEIYKKVIYNF